MQIDNIKVVILEHEDDNKYDKVETDEELIIHAEGSEYDELFNQ